MEDIKTRVLDAVKEAMRAKDQSRLNVLRLITAAIKQKEIDSRPQTGDTPLDDQQIIAVLDKMIKQRRESIEQFTQAGRKELADKEVQEISIIETFLPAALSEAEVNQFIQEAIQSSGATSAKDMGKVMNILRPQLQGRADMKVVSEKIKSHLSAEG
ncbi:MAG: GatB/YqeY domain-containing protein [Gammaproteobacteria bacterium]